MNMRALMVPALAAGTVLAAAGAASAAQVYDLDISYFNGDSFTGTVSLSQNVKTDTADGTFDYFTGSGRHKTAHSETIDNISTFGPIFGIYTSSLSGAARGEFATFSYTFGPSGLATPTKPLIEALDGVSSISLTPMAGVPEPSEWAVLLLGLFAVGAALRTRRAALATAAAA